MRPHSPVWNRLRRRIATHASEWAAARDAQIKAQEEARVARAARCQPWVERIGAYIEVHADELRPVERDGVFRQYDSGPCFAIDLPADFFRVGGDVLDPGDHNMLIELLLGDHCVAATMNDGGGGGMHLTIPCEPAPEIIRPDETEPLTPHWIYFGGRRVKVDEVVEFAPSSAAQGQEILWRLREAGRCGRTGELLRAMRLIRHEGAPDDPQVKRAIADDLLPAAALQWTAADWGRWTLHSLSGDDWPDRFALYTMA